MERHQGLASGTWRNTGDRLPGRRRPHRLHGLSLEERAGARASDRRRPARDDCWAPGPAVSAGEVRGRRGLPVGRGRAGRRVPAPRRGRGFVSRLSAPAAEHRSGDQLRLQLVPPAPRLDLKLFIHHGSYVRTQIVGRDELAGADVIVVHRLLKGTGAAAARGNGFALFTAPRSRRWGSIRPRSSWPRPRSQSSTLARFRRSPSTSRLAGRPRADDAASTSPRPIWPSTSMRPRGRAVGVWAHLTSPALRTLWEGPIAIEETLAGGRRGVGTPPSV